MSTTTILPPFSVKVHSYLPSPSATSSSPARPVQTYEHIFTHQPSSAASSPPQNALVFIGGLGDGPHTIPYVRHLATHLASAAPRWAVFEARLSSAFTGFGHGSLAQDARELADLVRYLRSGLGLRRVVLMGHSTGCQDCMEYATKNLVLLAEDGEEEGAVRVDGYVLQGPVSDREAIAMGEDAAEVKLSLQVAEGMVEMERGGEVVSTIVMPKGWKGTPVSAYRWWSLAAVGGDDDYFSSDFTDEQLAGIWGKLEQPVLILPSGEDEWVPPEVDVQGLVNRWKSFCKPGIASELSGLIPGANHRVDNDAGQQWLADRVARFLAEIESR